MLIVYTNYQYRKVSVVLCCVYSTVWLISAKTAESNKRRRKKNISYVLLILSLYLDSSYKSLTAGLDERREISYCVVNIIYLLSWLTLLYVYQSTIDYSITSYSSFLLPKHKYEAFNYHPRHHDDYGQVLLCLIFVV